MLLFALHVNFTRRVTDLTHTRFLIPLIHMLHVGACMPFQFSSMDSFQQTLAPAGLVVSERSVPAAVRIRWVLGAHAQNDNPSFALFDIKPTFSSFQMHFQMLWLKVWYTAFSTRIFSRGKAEEVKLKLLHTHTGVHPEERVTHAVYTFQIMKQNIY